MNFGDLARLPFSELNRQLEHCFLILRFTQYIIFISIFFEIRLANVQVFHRVRPILETRGFKTKYSRKAFSYANALLPNVRAEENIEALKKQTKTILFEGTDKLTEHAYIKMLKLSFLTAGGIPLKTVGQLMFRALTLTM